jgi:hypothetical protein
MRSGLQIRDTAEFNSALLSAVIRQRVWFRVRKKDLATIRPLGAASPALTLQRELAAAPGPTNRFHASALRIRI